MVVVLKMQSCCKSPWLVNLPLGARSTFTAGTGAITALPQLEMAAAWREVEVWEDLGQFPVCHIPPLFRA